MVKFTNVCRPLTKTQFRKHFNTKYTPKPANKLFQKQVACQSLLCMLNAIFSNPPDGLIFSWFWICTHIDPFNCFFRVGITHWVTNFVELIWVKPVVNVFPPSWLMSWLQNIQFDPNIYKVNVYWPWEYLTTLLVKIYTSYSILQESPTCKGSCFKSFFFILRKWCSSSCKPAPPKAEKI